jgi:hypothetical protein
VRDQENPRPSDEAGELEEKVAELRRAVVSHAVVDQAVGVVVAYCGLAPDAARDVLDDISRDSGTELRSVSERLVRWPHEGRLPDDLRRPLEAALDRRRGDTP